MATFNEEDRKWLYDTMKSKGINTGSYDDFKQCLDNDEDRQWYYDKGKELGLNLGSKEDFDGMMWENNPVGKTDGHTETPETVKVDGNTFTESQLEAVENGAKVVQQSRYGTPEYANEVIKDDLPDNPYAGMTRQQAVNAIGEKYRKEWYGKPGAYENIKSELASYNIASPSDYGHITAAIRNYHLQSVARQRVEQLLSPFKNVNSMTFDDVQEVLDSRATQKAIDEDARNLGLEQEDKDSYYQELEKQLEKVLTDKYGYLPSNDGRGSVSRYASSLINGGSGMHEERIREREAMSMIQGYLKDDIDATVSDYDRQAQEVKESTLKSTGADYSVAGGSNAGMQLGSLLLAQREANKVSDPEKILKDLTERSKALFDKMLSDEAFISNVMKQSEALGIEPDQYVADYVIPSFMKSMQREFSKSMTARELPKGRLDYIMRGLTDDSIIGMLVQKFVMTDSQIQYRDMANAKYGEGANIWLQGARMATGMASDFWLWGGWGKLGGAATRSLLNQRIMALAASKRITREAATRIMEEEARQYLSKGLFEHIMRHVPQSAVTMGGAEATTEAVRGYTRNEEIGDVLLNTFKSGMSGAATGTAFGVTGGAASRLTSQLSGVKRLAGKLAGLEVEAATLYTTEELQKMLSGDDAFENPFEGMFEANVKLGFIKASANPLESAAKFVNAVAHPVKTVKGMMEPDSKVLTEEDVADLRETFDGKGLVDAVTTMRPVRHTDGSEREGYITEEKAAVAAQAYNDYMANPDRPIDRKQRVARLLGGIVPPAGKEVRIDIDTTDGKTVLRTRDAKGQCVQELYFDSHQEAEAAANEMLYTIDQNTTTVLEDRISETAVYDLFRQKIDEEYQKVAAKYGDGVNPGVSSEMTETEKKWVYLHQHLDELLDITQAISDGRELGIDGQNLAEQFLGMFVEYSSSEAVASDNANRLRNAFEQQYGLNPGELDEIIRKGPGKRSDVESTILGEYQEFLRKRISDDDAAGKTDGHTEGTEGQAGGEAGAVNGTGGNEPPAGPATPDGETVGNIVIGEGQGEGQAIARSERRQAAYDRGKQAVQNPASLAAITYDSHLASLRLQQQFPENDPVLSRLRKDLMKAIVEGNDDEAERLMDLNAGNMNSRQKEAVEQYRNAMEMSRGVDDAVTEAVQAFQRQRHDELKKISAADGTVTELTLADGSKAYHIAGDPKNDYNTCIIADEEGNTMMVSGSKITAVGERVPMETILRADVDAYGQQLQQDLSGFASGTSLIPGSTVELGIGSYLVQVQYVGNDATGKMVFKEADGRQSVFTPQDVQQFVQEANRMKMESQLRQEKTAAIEQARADRFGKGIVGYSDGKADVSHKDTDAKVAAEYLEANVSSGETAGHSALLKSIQGEIDKLNELSERSRETVSRMAAKQELQGLSEQEEIALGESQAAIDDAAGRRRKWGEIRQALMTDEERRKFESERQKEIKKAMDAVKDIPAGKPLDTLAVPTGKELLEQYEEQGDAENAVETLRANLKAQYRDDVYPRLASVREAIEDYRRGLSDLTTDEINELAVSQKQLESQETAMMKQSQELKNLASSLGRLYAGRKKQQLSPHEYKMQQLEKETNKAKKLNLAKEAFADDEEALAVLSDLEPQDIYEHIADNLGEGSLSWEGFDRGEHHVRGVVDMVGKDKKRGIGKDSDTIGYNTFLAPTGQGKGYDEVVHAISEGSPYSTEDVANTLYDMLSSASKPTDISHRIIDERIARAEEIYEANREREREAEEDAKREALDQEIMQMTGMDPDEYDAYISDLESRLAEQEGYRSSEDYFNQTVERYEREQERNAGGSQETGALGLQGQEGEQGTGEGAAEEGAGGADAIAELQSDVNEFTSKYHSLPAEVISLDIPDAELIEKLGIPQYVIDHFGSEQKACEAVRNSLKEKKTVAAYNRESNKIIIFATAKRERIPEAMFHENVHGVLRGWYGDKEQSIATNFWNLSPDEGGKIDKSYIQKRYDEDEWKTEFFVTWLGRAMVDGTVDDMLKILSDPGDFERVNNILNAIGYDRAKETAERQGSGRLAEDNSSADGGRPEEGEVDAAGETDGHTEAQDFSSRLAEAKSETNTNPTEEQKKAGNYKMGHISFGGYRMSIENPKGSTRSGKDANGKAWSIEMQDTYGYIGKKYGADGDHLDFFINDDADLDNWNGRVYVVDQGIPATDQAGKPLGTLEFDEHKVMYGYPSFKAAKEAYERNYEAGWWDKHVIGMTGVRKDTFDAWLNDSDHKRKPFAEYSRTRNAETITDNVDQLLADVRERAMKEIDELKNITTTYEDGELESRTIPELEQLKKKRTKDASTARYLMAATNIKAGSEKEHTLLLKEAEAKADIAAINEALKAKKDEMQARIEQQEIGFAVTDRLNDMGYDVETDPKTVRRVRKQAEQDQSEEGKIRHMQTSDGTVYGFVYRGKMYIDIRKIDGNLPLHEYAHPWCEAFRKMNPDGWKAVVKTMQTDKDTWEFVKQLNPDLKTEDDIAEEMIAKGTGEKGEQYARAEYERMHGKDGDWKSKWNNIWKNIAKAIQNFWKQVGDYLHIKYESPDQVYDQVIRDFANNINPKKKMEQWLKERDKSYLEAVKTGDEAKAKELFDAALRENIGSGIVPFVSTGGYRGKLQKLAHGVKSRDPKVIAEVADLMAPIIPKDAVLVPAPSHGGEATDMLDLANAISERTGAPVADVLKSKERGSQYDAKKAGKPLSTVDLGITIDGKLPEGKLPVVIDNVVDTGNTAEACVRALGKGIVASLADSKGRFKRVTTLKSAEPVVTDKEGNVVPLSKRFELPFQFMVEGNLFSDADFDEPETATEVALTGRRLNKYGLNEDTTIGKKLTEFLDKNDAPNLLAGYVDSKTGDYVILGESVNDIEEYADANQLKNAGDMDGMAYVRLTSKDFDILSPKLVKEGYKMAFVDDKTDKPTKPKDAVDTMLDEVERRKEVASQKESEKRVKEYLDKHVKGQDAEVRKRATKAVLKAMDKAGVPYKVVSKEEERQMMQIFSMMNQESVKAFCRRADIRSTSRHGFGRYCVYNMADPFAVPMYHEKLSNAKEDVKQLKRMAPQGAWEILDIGYADEVQNDKELTGKAADMNLAELQAEIETWHGSGAVFAQFDHSHMGEGAGSQTFGWGTYVSGSKKVAEGYAHANDGLMKYKGAIIEKDPYSDNPAERALFYADQEGGFDKAVKFLKDLIKEEDDKSIINDYKETIKALQDKDSWSDVDRVLYNVQIPDESEAYYLDYKEKMDGQKDVMEMIDNNLFSEGWKRQEIDTRIRFKKGDEQIILTPNQSGADLYEELKEAMGGPKEASQWLNKIGLTGIKYPAGTIMGGGDNATNYVIFNEKDAKIVDSVQFMIGWHGTAAKFDAFDHSHMGEGEGNQAYGYGTYVTEVEGIGRKYAEAMANKTISSKFKGMSILALYGQNDEFWKSVGAETNDQRNVLIDIVRSLNYGYGDPVAMIRVKRESLEEAIIRRQQNIDRVKEELNSDVKEVREMAQKIIEKGEKFIAKRQSELDFVNSLDPNDFEGWSKPRGRYLYEVNIPDETGDNYFDWTENVPEGRVDEILAELRELLLADEKYGWNGQEDRLDDRLESMKSFFGETFYWRMAAMLGNSAAGARKEGQRLASELLSRNGYVGIKYPAEYRSGGRTDGAKNYVIFNEKDAKIVNTIQFMMGEAQKEGERIMGWSDGKQVYLTEAGLNPNTPLHETTHLWDKWCQKEKPELWEKVVDAMKKTAMWEEISKNPNYRNIWNDDNRMASEVHARLSGAKGEDEFMKAAFKKDTPQSIINEVKSVLRKFWESILRLFGKTTKTIGDEWSSLDAIIRMPLRDLLNKDFEKVLSVVESEPSMQAQAHIETDKADMEHKQRQLEIVTKANPMLDDYHTGIRKLDDIKTFEEAYLEGKENAEEGGYDEYASYPDITNDMIEEARKTGKITIYSSKPIKDGVFVTPSMMNAKDYAGNGKVYSKEVPIEDVAWINLEEGQYAKGDYGVMPRLGTPRVEAANERFNDELDKQISGELPKGHVYQLGKPGAVLLSTGFPNDNIELSATHLLDKSKAAHHPFELSDVKDLVRAINTPLAVFSYGDRSKAQNVIAEIQKDGKNFVVGIHFNQNPRGMVVSDIRGLYPKDNAEWLNWITQGKLLYANKEKIQNLIDKQRRTLAEVDYLDLNYAAKIVKDFENPKLSDEKIREIFPDYTNAGDNAAEQLGGVKVIWEQQTLESGTKGWYDPNTNTVHVAIDEVEDVDDAVRTVYHEKLGHEGLVALFATVGKTDGHTAQDEVNKFGQFVFKSANAEIRKRILDKADEEGYEWTDPLRHSKAAQEVLCDIAADGPRTGDEFTLWEKVKHYIIRLLNKLNIRIPGLLNDHDLAYYIVKTGEALKRWNGMSETARENLASQSTRYDIMRSRGGKPRKRNDESYSQYLERLRAWEKWKIAKETAFANGDPIPDQKTFNDKWEEAYRRDMDAWRNENHIPDTEMPGTGRRTEQSVFPKREDGESVQEYAKRVAEYETQKDILKTAPNYFEYVQKAQDEYKKAYTEWRERYDLEEAENVDLKVYEGEGGDGPRTDADVEAEGRMERDLADAVGVEIDSDGAKRHAKLAVIERRKNLESSNAEDAIWLYDFIKMTDDFAGKLPGTVTGKMLRVALPFIIEGTYWEEIVRDENGYPIGINDLSDQMPIKKSAELDELLAHVKEWYNEFYHLLEDAGLRNDAGYVENYVNHVWDKEKSDPKAWEKYVENYQRTKSPNMRHREIDTYQEGIDVGLVPKYKDIADMIAHYSRQNNEAIANKRFLEDLSGFVVDEVNSDGETVSVLPLLNSEKPDEFVRDRYSEYYVPGVGDVYVLKDVKKRFASIFGPLRTQDVADWLENAAKVYDLTSSTMKKIQLSISGFHALALSEVAVAQMRPDIAAKALVKYIILDSVRNKTIPAYAHPEDFMFAASHLVQLGATQDYAASDVNNITGKLRELMHELYESDGAVKKAAGAAGSVPAIMLDWVNKGMDKILWNYLHDGLKIACFKMFAEQIDERVKKEGLSEDLREKLLDEAGQYVNDTFGGQYFELLNITPATMKWLRRILLSPDWLISTQRHFFANFGFGSLYSDSSFKNYLKFNADNIKRAFGADITHDELRRFRSKNAKQCYLLGVCFFFYTMWNALNAMFRYQDEKNEREKADEIRKENPDYRSPYELAYPDGMKWYDYTMLGNGLGQQTHLFLGRYEDGSEEYVRWGKQFREFPEMFIGRHGVEFPTPLIERMQGKSNPMVSLVRDNLGALGVWGFTNSKDIEEIQAKYGKTIGVLAMNARHFLPFSVPTQAEKEFKAIDLLMPSQKGFTRYKTVDFFKTYIQAGDMEGIAKTYQAAVMNNIDAESCLKAAISTLNATQRKEMSDGVTDLTLAVERFDKAESLNERRQMREKIRKYLSGNEYKLFTRDEAIQQVNEFLDGGDMEQMTVNSQRYLMLQTSEDVIEDWKVSRLKSKAKEYSDKIKKFRDEGDDSRADALERTYEPWLEIKSEIGSYEYYLRRFKADLGDGKDAEVMKDIRQSRKELLHTIDSLRPPR